MPERYYCPDTRRWYQKADERIHLGRKRGIDVNEKGVTPLTPPAIGSTDHCINCGAQVQAHR